MAYMIPRLILLVLLTCLAGIFPASAQQGDTRVALLIGNAAYPDAEAPLRDPVNNVRALGEELRQSGFDVDIGENLTKEAMRAAIDRFYGKIKSGSTALLFFSGYGIQSDRQTYVIPVNAQIWTEADVRRDGYSLDMLLAEMNKRGAAVKIAILDASRRNPFERRFRAVAGGLAPVIVPKGTVVMYAAAPGAVARDGDRAAFVSELIKEIRAPGRIEEAFNRTLVGVSRASHGEQVPWFSSSLVEDFSFATAARPAPEPSPPVVQAEKKPAAPPPVVETEKKPVTPPDPDANARREYQSAERVGTRKGWEDFVAKYPSGRYADLAREQIARLAPPAAPAARVEDPAIKELDTKIQLNPGDAVAYYKRGQLHAQHGNYTRAVKDFDEVLRLNPRDPEALNNRCWARAVLGELQPALKDCDNALQVRPRYLDALDSRGFVNLKMGQASNAIADYDAALKINPRHASSLYGRGIAKLRIGNAAGGNGDIAAAKGIHPDIASEFASYGVR
jgi:regulator of sirC expression with transglutaminase-like and TPR domain